MKNRGGLMRDAEQDQTCVVSCIFFYLLKLGNRLIAVVCSLLITLPGVGSAAVGSGSAEALEVDQSVQNLTMVDGIDRFKRHVFLKQADLGGEILWIDNRKVLVSVPPEPSRNAGHPELPPGTKLLIDTESGAIERLPWSDDNQYTTVSCVNNGQIVFRQQKRVAEKQWSTVWSVGTFGGVLTTYYVENTLKSNMPKEWLDQGLRLDLASCRLVKWPNHLDPAIWGARSKRGSVSYLEPEHGWLIVGNPSRPNGVVGDYALAKPDGTKLPIPLTGGERTFNNPKYLPFADGYFVYPVLSFSDPGHVWTPHFARLIHPDGRIERFSVPGPLIERISTRQGNGAIVHARYSKRGPLWIFSPNFRDHDSAQLMGSYLAIGRELVRVAQYIRDVSPDGCKLVGETEISRHQMLYGGAGPQDYFVIDLCKEKSL